MDSSNIKEEPITEFFPTKTLKGYKFYFHCPNMELKTKTAISELIIEYEGVRKKNFYLLIYVIFFNNIVNFF